MILETSMSFLKTRSKFKPCNVGFESLFELHLMSLMSLSVVQSEITNYG